MPPSSFLVAGFCDMYEQNRSPLFWSWPQRAKETLCGNNFFEISGPSIHADWNILLPHLKHSPLMRSEEDNAGRDS
jgi:hypothetical protein